MSLSVATLPRSRLRRLLADAPLAVGVSALLAAISTLAIGKAAQFLENLVVSVLIGLIAYALINGGRLLFWNRSDWGLREWAAFVAFAVVAAPVAHFSGLHIAGVLLQVRTPTFTEYSILRQLNMIVFTLLGTSMMVVLMRHREHLRRADDEHAAARVRADTIERQALQAQLRLLQAQIEPHMLFNTLANLQGLIALDPVRASAMLDQLIQYLRATLSASRDESTTLEQEFVAMQAYLGLMGVRMGERLRYRLVLPPELRAARLPTMLLQPLVENAVVHGVEPKVDGGDILLCASVDGEYLAIEVHDTGLGLGQVHAPRGGGVGVATSRERLDVLYGERAALTLNSAYPQGTLARLTLPLEFAP